MPRSYLVRYGQTAARVGRFVSEVPLARCDTVVVSSSRGTELGEVLVESPHGPPAAAAAGGEEADRILRRAEPADLDRAREAEVERIAWFPACSRILEGGDSGLKLLDIEPLLEERRAVLYYLGPERFDTASLLAALRDALGLDPYFESVAGNGLETPTARPANGHASKGCEGCGSRSSSCGTGSCGTAAGGCSQCPIAGKSAARVTREG